MAPSLILDGLHSSERINPSTPDLSYPTRLFTSQPSLESLKRLCSQRTSPATCPLASSVFQDIPIYEVVSLTDKREVLSNPSLFSRLQDEWHRMLLSGPGVVVLKGMLNDVNVISSTNAAFDQIIASERSASGAIGDHFGATGANTRIWNSLQKHCIVDPTSFVKYYSNIWLSSICEAWLGPAHRVTAQVNIVHPGGKAQTSHRDYHLGFQTAETTARFPKSIQIASQLLTLQGAVAHSDMPVASGPTRLLPFSQMFEDGFLAYRLPEFKEWFEQNWVALELDAGDAVFFNPALFHAAGENQMEDFDRKANLLQISAAMGKTMENLDTVKMVDACWEELAQKYKREGWSQQVECVVKTVADGYPFPTNLDKRAPRPNGMAPSSEQEILKCGLVKSWSKTQVVEELERLRFNSAA